MRSITARSAIIVLVGLIGCLLTSMAGITAVMVTAGWAAQGGMREWLHRLCIAYPAASVVVVLVFPWLVPLLSERFGRIAHRWLHRSRIGSLR